MSESLDARRERQRARIREAGNAVALSETAELLLDLTARLKHREAQVASLLDVAEAAKVLLQFAFGPDQARLQAVERLRAALAATAEVRPKVPM